MFVDDGEERKGERREGVSFRLLLLLLLLLRLTLTVLLTNRCQDPSSCRSENKK